MEEILTAVPKHYYVSLDMKRSVSNTDFEVVEGDTENYITVTLTDGGSPVSMEGYRILAVFSHSQGSCSQDSEETGGGISISENTITIHLKNGSFKRGIVECELRISGNPLSRVSTTPTFNFTCRPPLISDSTVEAEDRMSHLSGLLQQVNSALNTADIAISEANSIPRLYVMYCDTDPTLPSASLTEQKGKYMGFCYSTGKSAPTAASAYKWFDSSGNSYISKAAISDKGVLSFTMSNNVKLNDIDLSTCFGSLIAKKQDKSLAFANTAVLPDSFLSDDTYADYPYKVEIACAGVTADMTGYVTLDVNEAVSGNFSPVAETGDGIVTLFCRSIPEGEFTVPMIKAESLDTAI